MTILAIDPGPVESAWVLWDGARVLFKGKEDNAAVLHKLGYLGVNEEFGYIPIRAVVLEEIASYGMPVGREVFATVFWSGRFAQASLVEWHLMPRKDVKLHLCQSPRANDATIRQALIDRFGGKAVAIGKKAAPGPLWGLKADMWSALALAVTWHDTHGRTVAGTPETRGEATTGTGT